MRPSKCLGVACILALHIILVSAGRRGGTLRTRGSFTLSSGGNRGGNEELKESVLDVADEHSITDQVTDDLDLPADGYGDNAGVDTGAVPKTGGDSALVPLPGTSVTSATSDNSNDQTCHKSCGTCATLLYPAEKGKPKLAKAVDDVTHATVPEYGPPPPPTFDPASLCTSCAANHTQIRNKNATTGDRTGELVNITLPSFFVPTAYRNPRTLGSKTTGYCQTVYNEGGYLHISGSDKPVCYKKTYENSTFAATGAAAKIDSESADWNPEVINFDGPTASANETELICTRLVTKKATYAKAGCIHTATCVLHKVVDCSAGKSNQSIGCSVMKTVRCLGVSGKPMKKKKKAGEEQQDHLKDDYKACPTPCDCTCDELSCKFVALTL